MPLRSGQARGRHLVNCSRCAMTYYDSQTAKEWTGDIVCKGAGTRNCYEQRSPIDFIRSVVDQNGVQDARTRSTSGPGTITVSYVEGGYWMDFSE